MRKGQSAPKGFLYGIGILGIVVGILVALAIALPLQPPLSQASVTQTRGQGVVYVDMPLGVGSDVKLNYVPVNITVVIGVNSTVVWRNLDTVVHTVTANNKAFNSGDIKAGSSFEYTFTKPGVYDYYCIYHAWMKGTVTVKQGSAVKGVTVNMPAGVGTNTKLNYEPVNITVVIGINNTVTWVNQDNAKHTVTSTSKLFNSGDILPGGSWSYTFTKPGVYEYYCLYHVWMKGYVIVKSTA